MRIIVGSQSDVKLYAVKAVLQNLGIEADVIGVDAASGVSDQPMGDETERGALQRLADAKKLDGEGDVYIAIESGLFPQSSGDYVDRAVVVIMKGEQEYIGFSDGVTIKKEFVDEAQKIGFDKTTVGKIMMQHGVVRNHQDPHESLIGKSRGIIIAETAERLFRDDLGWGRPNPAAASFETRREP